MTGNTLSQEWHNDWMREMILLQTLILSTTLAPSLTSAEKDKILGVLMGKYDTLMEAHHDQAQILAERPSSN